MRQSVYIILLLLVVWITGSSYWYVCRIRCDCRQNSERTTPESAIKGASITEDSARPALSASIDEAGTWLKNKGTIIVHFQPGSVTIEPGSLPDEYLKYLKLYLDNKPESKIMVTGHADISGSGSENTKLSRMRAEAVKSFMVSSGISADQIGTSFKSDKEPVTSNNTPEGRSENRRAEINLINL